MKTMKIRGIYMDTLIWKHIEDESKRIDRSVNWVVADILKSWIEKRKKARAKGK